MYFSKIEQSGGEGCVLIVEESEDSPTTIIVETKIDVALDTSRTIVTHNTNEEIARTIITSIEAITVLRYYEGLEEWFSCKRDGSHGGNTDAGAAANDPLNALVEAIANEVRMYHATRVALKTYVCKCLNISKSTVSYTSY